MQQMVFVKCLLHFLRFAWKLILTGGSFLAFYLLNMIIERHFWYSVAISLYLPHLWVFEFELLQRTNIFCTYFLCVGADFYQVKNVYHFQRIFTFEISGIFQNMFAQKNCWLHMLCSVCKKKKNKVLSVTFNA